MTIIVISFFPWYTAQTLLQIVVAIAVFATAFWYLKSRRLYFESQSKSCKILAGQRELRIRQKTIDLVYENSTDGILLLDSEQRIESFSKGMEKITGYRSEEIIGLFAKQILRFRAPKEESLLPDLMFIPKSVKKHPLVKNYLTTKEGREITIEASFTSIKTDNGDKALAIVRDITYEEDLIERDKEFIAITSHQMNTPLSIMRGYLSMIADGKVGKLSPQQKDYIEEIYNSTKKLISLTDNLLSISRIEQEKINIKKEEISMVNFLQKFKTNLHLQRPQKGVVLRIKEPKFDFVFDADKEKLETAIGNLIDNSMKYTRQGEIVVTAEKQDKKIVFHVDDTGIGIPESELEKIGQKFYRSQNAINLDSKGTGLGLFISKTIIDKHGGNIKIDSQENRGTKITVTIPRI
jgi:PAS domain S-box-containing protein